MIITATTTILIALYTYRTFGGGGEMEMILMLGWRRSIVTMRALTTIRPGTRDRTGDKLNHFPFYVEGIDAAATASNDDDKQTTDNDDVHN